MDANKKDGSNPMYYKPSASSSPTTAVWHNCDKENELLAVDNAGVTQYTIGSLLDDLGSIRPAYIMEAGLLTNHGSIRPAYIMEAGLLTNHKPSSTSIATPSATVSDIVKVGYVEVRYIPVYADTETKYQFPVYVEVRNNCAFNATNFGTNGMTD